MKNSDTVLKQSKSISTVLLKIRLYKNREKPEQSERIKRKNKNASEIRTKLKQNQKNVMVIPSYMRFIWHQKRKIVENE